MLALATDGARNRWPNACPLRSRRAAVYRPMHRGLRRYEMASSPSRVMFFDVSTPEDPIFKSQYVPIDENGYPLENADALL